MDTLSRESSSNSSLVPYFGIAVGVLALILAGVSLAQVSSAKREAREAREALEPKINEVEASARGVQQKVDSLISNAQRSFEGLSSELGNIRTEVNRVTISLSELEKKKAPAPAPSPKNDGGNGAAPAPGSVGEDGSYTVKSGDNFSKIARALGTTVPALQEANPGVNSSGLKVGQKLRIPRR